MAAACAAPDRRTSGSSSSASPPPPIPKQNDHSLLTRDNNNNCNDNNPMDGTYANCEQIKRMNHGVECEMAADSAADKSKSKKNKKKQETKKSNSKKGKQDDKTGGKKQDSRLPKTNNDNGKQNRGLVEELKLFQNNHLLKQQDPMEQLQRQLHHLMTSDNHNATDLSLPPPPLPAKQSDSAACHQSISQNQEPVDPEDDNNNYYGNLTNGQPVNGEPLLPLCSYVRDTNDHINTIKKGVLWQQQHYEKFHQRIFNRWKKRYFILTTHYLVCLKRSNSTKVGQSEMGKFIYKTALSDVLKIERSKPDKSDKGPIVLHFNGQFNLLLWCKKNLDDWMFVLEESISRLRSRRSNQIPAQKSLNSDTISPNTTTNTTNANKEPQNNGSLDHCNKSNGFSCNSANVINGLVAQTGDFYANMELANENGSLHQRPAAGSLELGSSKQEPDTQRDRNNNSKEPEETERSQLNTSGNLDERCQDQPADSLVSDRRKLDDEREDAEQREEQEKEVHLASETERDTEIEPTLDPNSDVRKGEPDGDCDGSAVIYDPSNASNDERHSRSSSSSAKKSVDEQQVSASCQMDQPKPEPHTELELLPANRQPVGRSLIRRDDSWQSLVSLTRVGKTPNVWRRQQPTPEFSSQDNGRWSPNQTKPSHTNTMAEAAAARDLEPDFGVARGRLPASSRLLESSVTPSRGPLLRHNSAAAGHNHLARRRLGPLPPIGGQTQSASFELSTGSGQSEANGESPLNLGTRQQKARQLSYQQNLLRLQMMHNNQASRFQADDPNNQGAEIYSPESTVYGGLYGYSSMRSNLKSAASEFAFIRPVSLVHQPAQQLPMAIHPNQHPNQNQIHLQDRQSTLPPQSGTFQRDPRASMLIQHPVVNGQQALDPNSQATCLSPLARQFLVNPMTGERMLNQQLQLTNGTAGHLQAAPLRELPLKPSKRRLNQTADEPIGKTVAGQSSRGVPKSSSLGSSIAGFFRRHFSRRGSRNSKLPASCSSSMGAFEEVAYANGPLIPSAFSTGSKSIVDTGPMDSQRVRDRQVLASGQSPRMIDMIEAFAERTQLNVGRPLSSSNGKTRPLKAELEPSQLVSPKAGPGQQLRMMAVNQFGSPLHKSNSISTTMGLAGTMLYENGSEVHQSPLIAAVARGNGNLTPRHRHSAAGQPQARPRDSSMLLDLEPGAFVSPRAGRRHEPLPRPISLSGQPSSMIAQVMNRDDYGPIGGGSGSGYSRQHNNHLGSHRNSLQNFSQMRQLHNQSFEQQPPPANRRHNYHYQHLLSKGPFPLDTTSEIGEELASPMGPRDLSINHDHGLRRGADRSERHQHLLNHHAHQQLAEINEQQTASLLAEEQELAFQLSRGQSPMRLTHHMASPRQALVNPIIQSPTMNTIYDNHPSVRPEQMDLRQLEQLADGSIQQLPMDHHSHYDNHNPLMMVHSPSMGSASSRRQQQQQSSLRRHHRYNQLENGRSFEGHYQRQASTNGFDGSSPLIHQAKANELHGDIAQGSRLAAMATAVGATPSRNQRPQSSSSYTSMSLTNIIDHHTPIIQSRDQQQRAQEIGAAKLQANGHWKPAAIVTPSTPRQQQQQQQAQDESSQRHGRSPMLSRRMFGQQQSTSHYQQSPLVSGQTRVLHKPDGVQATITDRGQSDQSASRSAPAVAANQSEVAYENGTLDRLSSSGSSSLSSGRQRAANGVNRNNKANLVACRMSQSAQMTCNEDEEASLDLSLANRDEISSSDSRSANSSTGNGPTSRQAPRAKRSSLASDDNSSGNETNPKLDGSRRGSGQSEGRSISKSQRHKERPRAANRRGSSTSNHSSEGRDQFIELDNNNQEEERRWINSKLASHNQ